MDYDKGAGKKELGKTVLTKIGVRVASGLIGPKLAKYAATKCTKPFGWGMAKLIGIAKK